MIIAALLVVANGLGAALLIPQVRRLRRTRSVAGISASGVGIGLGLNGWWLVYAAAIGAPGIVPASVAGVALYLVVADALWRDGGDRDWRDLVRGAVIALLAPLAAAMSGGTGALGLAMGLAYTVQFAPAAVSAVTADDVSGIAPATWWMAWAEAAIWALYGFTLGDPALVVGGIGGATMAGIVITRTALSGGRALPRVAR